MIAGILQSDARRFNRTCAVIGLAFLLLTQLGKWALYQHRGLSQAQDFSQYYMGGVMALRGDWDALYPEPIPGARHNAGFEDSSTLLPKYRDAAIERGVGEGSYRFMQPPPAALLFVPFALLPLKTAHLTWIILLTIAAWGVALQAGEMFRVCANRVSQWSGLLIVLVCISPQAHRWVRVGNLSVAMAWLTGFIVLKTARRDSVGAGAAMTVGVALKYAQAVLVPLQIAARRWRTIAWEVVLGAALLLISVLIMGLAPYRTFFTEIVPTLGRTTLINENASIYAFLLRISHINDETAMPETMHIFYRIAQVLMLLWILALILPRPRRYWENPSNVFAAALALIVWMMIFSPIFWEHYHANLTPFWGWLLYRAMRSRGAVIAATAAIVLAFLPASLIVQQLHLPTLPEPLQSHLLFSAIIMLAMAMVTLIRRDETPA